MSISEHLSQAAKGGRSGCAIASILAVSNLARSSSLSMERSDGKLSRYVLESSGRSNPFTDFNGSIGYDILVRSPERLYLNEVETTSSYELLESRNISAEQITAIYFSPQDPEYFTAGNQPVALYRYHLDLSK